MAVALFALMLSGMFYYMYRIRRRRNKELHLINASKDKLFSIISHDLKSPVAAQRLALEGLLDNLEEYDRGQLARHLRLLHHSTEAQMELLQNLLNWARMETGQMKYNSTQFDMGMLMKEVAGVYELPAQNKGVTLRTRIEENCIVQADRPMIHTVMRNLMNNAVKFSHPGSEILVSVSCDDEHAHVTVKDSGMGMTALQIEKLFTPGEARLTTGTRGEKGSGLGLIICKDLLQRNGSGLHINSAPNVGTEVSFSLKI